MSEFVLLLSPLHSSHFQQFNRNTAAPLPTSDSHLANKELFEDMDSRRGAAVTEVVLVVGKDGLAVISQPRPTPLPYLTGYTVPVSRRSLARAAQQSGHLPRANNRNAHRVRLGVQARREAPFADAPGRIYTKWRFQFHESRSLYAALVV